MRVVTGLILLGLGGACSCGWADSTDKSPNRPVTVANLPASIVGGVDSAAPGAMRSFVPVPVPVADKVIVRKSERRLILMRHGEVLRSYRISLGLMPDGPKGRAGDLRTPEGDYLLTRRNPRSDFFLSILVSYPNDQDQQRARRE